MVTDRRTNRLTKQSLAQSGVPDLLLWLSMLAMLSMTCLACCLPPVPSVQVISSLIHLSAHL